MVCLSLGAIALGGGLFWGRATATAKFAFKCSGNETQGKECEMANASNAKCDHAVAICQGTYVLHIDKYSVIEYCALATRVCSGQNFIAFI